MFVKYKLLYITFKFQYYNSGKLNLKAPLTFPRQVVDGMFEVIKIKDVYVTNRFFFRQMAHTEECALKRS